jgi:hypothetical protein
VTGEGGDDDADGDEWGQQHREASKRAQEQIDSPSRPSAFERKMVMFHRRRVAQTVSDIPDGDTQSLDEEPLFFPASDEEVPHLAEGVDQSNENDEGQHPRSSASVAKVKSAHRPGPLPDKACRKAHELGDSVMKALQELAVQYGKPVQRILEEAGLKKLATRGEQRWNLHQKWYAICHPITDNGKYDAPQFSLIDLAHRECERVSPETKGALMDSRFVLVSLSSLLLTIPHCRMVSLVGAQ